MAASLGSGCEGERPHETKQHNSDSFNVRTWRSGGGCSCASVDEGVLATAAPWTARCGRHGTSHGYLAHPPPLTAAAPTTRAPSCVYLHARHSTSTQTHTQSTHTVMRCTNGTQCHKNEQNELVDTENTSIRSLIKRYQSNSAVPLSFFSCGFRWGFGCAVSSVRFTGQLAEVCSGCDGDFGVEPFVGRRDGGADEAVC